MKKRINSAHSIQKGEKGAPFAAYIDIRRQKPQSHKFTMKCPPKVNKKDHVQTINEEPRDNQLRNIAKINKDYLSKQIKLLRSLRNCTQRRRCKSSDPQIQSTLQKDVEMVKGKIEQLQNQKDSARFLLMQEEHRNKGFMLQIAQLHTQIQKLKSHFIYIELLVFKCGQILQENLNSQSQDGQFYSIERQKVELVLATLRKTSEDLKSQSEGSFGDVMQKMKQEAESMVLYLTQQRMKSLNLLREKDQHLQQERNNIERADQCYEQVKFMVNQLNDEVNHLCEQIDKKDQFIEYLKIENNNLKEDLKSMEELVKQTKESYHALNDELCVMNEKIRMTELVIQRKDEHANQLVAEIESKNRELISKLDQIQSKQEDIAILKLSNTRNQEMITSLNQELQLILLENQKKQLDLNKSESRVHFLQEQGRILERKMEAALTEDENNKYIIAHLEEKVQSLEKDKEQLYKDISSLEHDQDSSLENRQQLDWNYEQLKEEVKLLKLCIANLLLRLKKYEGGVSEAQQSDDVSVRQLDFRIYEDILEQQQKYRVLINEPQNPQSQLRILQNTGNHPSIEPSSQQAKSEVHPFLENIQSKSSRASALSHYEIYIIDENSETVHTHSATCQKHPYPNLPYPKDKGEEEI